MKHLNIIILFFLIALTACETNIDESYLKLPALVGDNMVLQRNTDVKIWGWSNPKQLIEITAGWDQKSYKTKTLKDGTWSVTVPTIEEGGPYTLTIKAGKSIELKNILLGDVWVCSGQSNMEWTLGKAEIAELEIPLADFPTMRVFKVAKNIAPYPVDDVVGEWLICKPENAGNFSAVGYFFGKELVKELNIPIGLINTSWGGTPSEAWTSKETLMEIEDYSNRMTDLYGHESQIMDLIEAQKKADEIKLEVKRVFDFENPDNVGKVKKYMDSNFDDSDWAEINCPAEWSTVETGMVEGVVWMRKTIEIPEAWIGKEMSLELGPIDEMDETFVNGILVGSNAIIDNWNKSRFYTIHENVINDEKVVIAVRALNTMTQGGFIGEKEEMKLFPKSIAMKNAVTLAGNWKYKITYRIPEIPQITNPHTPSYLYNAMINPIIKMPIKGAIWYQGEANVNRAQQYKRIFPAMINDWRSKWGIGDFPFYFVQLAPFNYGDQDKLPELREAQFMTLKKVPNTGMAVTMDIGNPRDIHPTNKRDVGHRLDLWALANDYGKNIVPSGPLYKSYEVEGRNIRVLFDYAENGLLSKDGEPTHFEISGNDKEFMPAKAKVEGNSVIVWNEHISNPVAVRYGWSDTAEPNLFNTEGLPASSFASDDWDRITK